MNIKDLMLLVANIESTRSISKDIVVAAVEEALAKAYRKQIEIPDAIVLFKLTRMVIFNFTNAF